MKSQNCPSRNRIYTVEDAGLFLLDWIRETDFQNENEEIFSGRPVFATFRVPFEAFDSSLSKMNVEFQATEKKEKGKKISTLLPYFQQKRNKKKNNSKVLSLQEKEAKNMNEELEKNCQSSNDCLMFGKLQQKIKKQFHDFDFNTDLFLGSSKNIWRQSTKNYKSLRGSNSMIRELFFKKGNFLVSLLLKGNLQGDQDSILFEYLAGKEYINRLHMTTPIFIETYNLYAFKDSTGDPKKWFDKFKLNPWLFQKDFLSGLTSVTESNALHNFLHFCMNPILAMSIQFVKDSQSFADWLEVPGWSKERSHEFVLILFQVYFNLLRLKDTFTHYDLHDSNIILYQPDKSKKILFTYDLPNGKNISFYSSYFVKVIDYGRCYFDSHPFYEKEETNKIFSDVQTGITSMTLYEISKQKTACHDQLAFLMFPKLSSIIRHSWIVSYLYNPSHDLRLLYSVLISGHGSLLLKQKFREKETKIVYKEEFGTPPVYLRGYCSQTLPNMIFNSRLSFSWSYTIHGKLIHTIPSFKSEKHTRRFKFYLENAMVPNKTKKRNPDKREK